MSLFKIFQLARSLVHPWIYLYLLISDDLKIFPKLNSACIYEQDHAERSVEKDTARCTLWFFFPPPRLPSLSRVTLSVTPAHKRLLSSGAVDKAARCDQWNACWWTPLSQGLIAPPKSLPATSCGFISLSLFLSSSLGSLSPSVFPRWRLSFMLSCFEIWCCF